jgi:uncharacterized membrane protein
MFKNLSPLKILQIALLIQILILVFALPFLPSYFVFFKVIATIAISMILSYFINNV